MLFPIRDGAIFTGTFRDNNVMYDGMIKAFNRAISSLGEEEKANVCRDLGISIVRRIGCYKGFGKAVRYNDSMQENERATYCVIH